MLRLHHLNLTVVEAPGQGQRETETEKQQRTNQSRKAKKTKKQNPLLLRVCTALINNNIDNNNNSGRFLFFLLIIIFMHCCISGSLTSFCTDAQRVEQRDLVWVRVRVRAHMKTPTHTRAGSVDVHLEG